MVRLPLAALHRMKRFVWKLLRIRTRGVKVMVFDEAGRLLLIRNTYGRSDLFVLPGGGIGRREEPTAAARREIQEEVACAIQNPQLVSIHVSRAEGRRDLIYLFRATSADVPVPDGLEVQEARFYAIDALPPNVSPATLRRIEEHRRVRPADGRW